MLENFLSFENRLQLLLILPFAVGIAAWETTEWVHLRRAANAPIVEGDIIRREEFRRFGGIPAGRLTIQIVGRRTMVVAVTNKAAMQDLPRRVRFHYTGDPKREVFIEGEEHPFWVALFLWFVAVGTVAFCIVMPLLHRRSQTEVM